MYYAGLRTLKCTWALSMHASIKQNQNKNGWQSLTENWPT